MVLCTEIHHTVGGEDTDCAERRPRTHLDSTIRQHAGAGLVAAGIVAAAIARGPLRTDRLRRRIDRDLGCRDRRTRGPCAAHRSDRQDRGRRRASASPDTAVLAMASVAWASDQGRAFEEAVRVSFYLGLFALAVCTAEPGRAGASGWAGWRPGSARSPCRAVRLSAARDPRQRQQRHPECRGPTVLPHRLLERDWRRCSQRGAILLAHGGVGLRHAALRTVATAAIPMAVLGIWLATREEAWQSPARRLGHPGRSRPRDRTRQLITVAIGHRRRRGTDRRRRADGFPDERRCATPRMRADGDRMSAIVIAVVAVTALVAWRLDGGDPIAGPRGVALGQWRRSCRRGPCRRRDRRRPGRSASTSSRRRRRPSGGVPVGAAELSSNGRWQFWGEAVDAFEAIPLGGVGAGGYEDYWARHADVPLFVRNPHSLPLQQAAELGIPGILLFLGFLGAVAVAGCGEGSARARRGTPASWLAVVAAAAVGAAVDWTWEIPGRLRAGAWSAPALLPASAPSPRLARGTATGSGSAPSRWPGSAMVAGGLVVLTRSRARSEPGGGRGANRDRRWNRPGRGRQDGPALVRRALHAARAARGAAGGPRPGRSSTCSRPRSATPRIGACR